MSVGVAVGLAMGLAAACLAAHAATRPSSEAPVVAPAHVRTLNFGASKLRLHFDPEGFQVSERDVEDWVLRSARAAAAFFGRFPANDVRIVVKPGRGREVMEGEASWNPRPRILVTLGRETTPARLKRDSTLVHEMAHLGFPDMDDAHLWLHEGLATYVEAVARAQARELPPAQMWAWLAFITQQGLPDDNEKRGLDRTKDEDRRYYGGALFWLTADVEIRKRTGNRRGVRDAIRAIFNAGGTLSVDWTPEKALRIGDEAVGVPVLSQLFPTWRKTAVSPDLDSLWRSLGIDLDGTKARLVEDAPLAALRRSITAIPPRPMLLRPPAMLYEATRR